jgi:catechol 2,3-dioxygenase-like lactoylglutathione lyase family enzyme
VATIGQLHHLLFAVRDLATAERFYGEALGLESLGRDRWPEPAPNATFRTEDGQHLVLVEDPAAVPNQSGLPTQFRMPAVRWHLIVGRLREMELPVASRPGELVARGEQRVWTQDPDGNPIVLVALEPSAYETPSAGAGKLMAGRINDFAIGSVTRLAKGRCYLVRTTEGFTAISEICTHRQFTVVYEPEHYRFYCPLHHNRYEQTGEVAVCLSKEFPPPLRTYAIEFVDGQVVVDTDESLGRREDEPVPIYAPPIEAVR